MTIIYQGTAILVDDINAARQFYTSVLGQSVEADHGPHVAFAGGFSIWQADHAHEVIFGTARIAARLGANNVELYFESEDVDEAWNSAMDILGQNADIIHPVVAQPWGQRGFRLRDPDGHIVEVAEPLRQLVRRLRDQGLGFEDIAAKTSIPLEGVKALAIDG